MRARQQNQRRNVAKQSASGHVIYYPPSHDSYGPERLALMTELHRAIETNQLLLAYQPKIDLGTRRIVGVEGWHAGSTRNTG